MLQAQARGGDAMMTLVKTLDAPVLTTNRPSSFADQRRQREFKTIAAMVHIFCRDHHQAGLCGECDALLAYAALRLERCRFGAEKPTCAKCPVHCYQRS